MTPTQRRLIYLIGWFFGGFLIGQLLGNLIIWFLLGRG